MSKDDNHSGNRTVDGINADRAFGAAPCSSSSSAEEYALSGIRAEGGRGTDVLRDSVDTDSGDIECDSRADETVIITPAGKAALYRAKHIRVACPTCDAPAGKPCIGARGPTRSTHWLRRDAARNSSVPAVEVRR